MPFDHRGDGRKGAADTQSPPTHPPTVLLEPASAVTTVAAPRRAADPARRDVLLPPAMPRGAANAESELEAVRSELAYALRVKPGQVFAFGSATIFSQRPDDADIDLLVKNFQSWPSDEDLKRFGIKLSLKDKRKSDIGTLTRDEETKDACPHHALVVRFLNFPSQQTLNDWMPCFLQLIDAESADEGSQSWIATGNGEFKWHFSPGTELGQAMKLAQAAFFDGEGQDLWLGKWVQSRLGKTELFPDRRAAPQTKHKSWKSNMDNVKVEVKFDWYPLSRLASPKLPSVDVTTLESGYKLWECVRKVFDSHKGAVDSYIKVRGAQRAQRAQGIPLRSAALQCGLLAFIKGYGNSGELEGLESGDFTKKWLSFWCGIDWTKYCIRDLALTEKDAPDDEVRIFDPFAPKRHMPSITMESLKRHNELLCEALGLAELIPCAEGRAAAQHVPVMTFDHGGDGRKGSTDTQTPPAHPPTVLLEPASAIDKAAARRNAADPARARALNMDEEIAWGCAVLQPASAIGKVAAPPAVHPERVD